MAVTKAMTVEPTSKKGSLPDSALVTGKGKVFVGPAQGVRDRIRVRESMDTVNSGFWPQAHFLEQLLALVTAVVSQGVGPSRGKVVDAVQIFLDLLKAAAHGDTRSSFTGKRRRVIIPWGLSGKIRD
jgi:hypothetical protein